jgi:hypothetical protein
MADKISMEGLVGKGNAKPVEDGKLPGKPRTAITIRLEDELYRRLTGYSSSFNPRRSHQDIVVKALEQFLPEL